MLELSDWQWGVVVVAALVSLSLGGWLNHRRRSQVALEAPEPQGDRDTSTDSEDVASIANLLSLPHPPEVAALEAELADAREEAELILLQLHQVQEELEHYFLLSRELQQQLDEAETAPLQVGPAPSQAELQAIKQRLAGLLRRQAQAPSSITPALLAQQRQSLQRAAQLVQRAQGAGPEQTAKPVAKTTVHSSSAADIPFV